jgi:hypothetical protein
LVASTASAVVPEQVEEVVQRAEEVPTEVQNESVQE